MNGYKNGYLRGYFDRVKEKRATASQKTIEIINNQLRKISEIISEENTKEQQKTK